MLVSDGVCIYNSLCDEIVDDSFFHNCWKPEQFLQPSNVCAFYDISSNPSYCIDVYAICSKYSDAFSDFFYR